MIDLSNKKEFFFELNEFINKYPSNHWQKIFEFEQIVKDFFLADFVCSCSSWNAWIFLVLKSFSLRKQDEIICCCLNFISAPNCVLENWAKIIFCDVWDSPIYYSIQDIKNKVSKNTKWIIVTHLFWYPIHNIFEIKKLCDELWIFLIEDCCQSIWAKIKNKYVWTIWDFWVFSFDSNKFVKSWEWWMILSNNKKHIDEINKLKNFYKQDFIFKKVAYNFRFNDFSAIYAKYSFLNLHNSINRRIESFKKLKKYVEDRFSSFIEIVEWNWNCIYYSILLKFLKHNNIKYKFKYLSRLNFMWNHHFKIKKNQFKNFDKLDKLYYFINMPINVFDDDKHLKNIYNEIETIWNSLSKLKI